MSNSRGRCFRDRRKTARRRARQAERRYVERLRREVAQLVGVTAHTAQRASKEQLEYLVRTRRRSVTAGSGLTAGMALAALLGDEMMREAGRR